MLKNLTTAALAIALGLTIAEGARASDICASLNEQLTTLSETHSAPTQVRKYARAIAEQKMNIRALTHQMRETGCSAGSLIVVGGENADECDALESKMMRMERNLDILNNKRISLITGETQDAKRRLVLAKLEQNRCNDQPIMANAEPENVSVTSLVTETPDGGEQIRVPSSEPDYSNKQFIDLGGASVNGSYRTMCVRACDGAYFPISSQASTYNFGRDAQVCSMMCPGTETELYYHPAREESSEMRSALTGQPYDELPNAYRFRTEKRSSDQACSCNFSLYYKEMMKRQAFINNPDQAPAKQSSIVWVKPELRGQIERKPETKMAATEVKLRDYKPDEGVRLIGPKFLPDEESIDFTAPTTAARK